MYYHKNTEWKHLSIKFKYYVSENGIIDLLKEYIKINFGKKLNKIIS